MDDSPHEVDVFGSQAACLGQAEPDESAQQYHEPDACREQFVQLPYLLSGRHVNALLSHMRGSSPQAWRFSQQPIMDRIAHNLREPAWSA